MTDSGYTVARNDAESRYEIHDGETLAGYAVFEQRTGRVRFVHTVIDPAFRGKGLGELLAADALADVAQRGDTIVPICPFIAKYLRANEVAGAIVDWPEGDDQEAATPGEQPA